MSEANCGISVHEVTQVRVSDSEGNAMNQGDNVRGRNQKPLPCQEHQEIQSSKERIRRCSR